MMLWIVLTAMTAIAAVWAAAPFLRGERSLPGLGLQRNETAVYRDQLQEIDREAAAGIIDAREAEGARQEVARRLILAERAEAAASSAAPVASADRTYAAVGIAAVVALGSTILYANIGAPDVPSAQPGTLSLGGRDAGGSAMSPRHPPTTGAGVPGQGSAAGTAAREPSSAGEQSAGAGLATVDDMIERLVQRLKAKPDDADGWRMLGWSYFSQERYAEAAAAYGEALKRTPDMPALRTARGEALVRAAGGLVTPEAATLFDEALAKDKRDPRARFFLGLKKEQTGDKTAALDDWIAILKDAAPGEPWVGDLRQRVEELAAELKVSLAGRLPSAVATPPPADRGGILDKLQQPEATAAPPQAGQPSAADVKRAEAMSAEDRSAMIRGMVDGLQARLDKSPRDADGWMKLIRSRIVLGDKDAARAALKKALDIFAGDTAEKNALAATAKELGLE